MELILGLLFEFLGELIAEYLFELVSRILLWLALK